MNTVSIHKYFFTLFFSIKVSKFDFSGGAIELCRQMIIPLYDPPHLIQGSRNNLLIKDRSYFSKNGSARQ